jgi:2-dehydropantoate 2-reductase
MKIAILGVGSLGTILGAFIQKGGTDIDLIDVNKEHVDALNKNGATVVGTTNFNVPVKALTPDEMEGIYDLVFLMVKQTYNKTALTQLLPHLGPDSVVCTLQNGVPEPAVAEIVGEERTIGGTVSWGATWIKPGVSELTSAPDKLSFEIGEIDGRITDRLYKVKEVLGLMCETHIMNNLMGVRWTKLLINATFSGMSTVLGCTFGDILDNKEALLVAKYIANENIHAGISAGIKMEPMQGLDLGKLLRFKTIEERDSNDETYREFFGPHRKLKASMLQDLEKGRKCEIDAINGVVCDFGRKYGVETPVNDQVVEIVRGIQDGKYEYKFSNLELIKIPG